MTVVVKIGGARAVDPAGTVTDVAHLTANGEDVIVVHGGSTVVDDTLKAVGETPRYVETPDGVGGRFTDERAMEAIKMALPGQCNTDLVTAFQNGGVNAVGLSGVDGKLLTGPRTSAVRVQDGDTKRIERGDHSGTITDVDVTVFDALLSAGFTPVVSPPMLGDDAATGEESTPAWLPVNVDADGAAAAIAGALDATLLLLTDVSGVLDTPDDPETVFETVDEPAALDAVQNAAEDFMGRKVMAAIDALDAGAVRVIIGDANRTEPVLSALDGDGTHLLPGAVSTAETATGTEDTLEGSE